LLFYIIMASTLSDNFTFMSMMQQWRVNRCTSWDLDPQPRLLHFIKRSEGTETIRE